MSETRGKPFPRFDSDEAAADFLDTADLSEYDMSDMKPTRMEDFIKEVQVNVRLPRALYQAVKAEAARQGVPYSRFVRTTLERAVGGR